MKKIVLVYIVALNIFGIHGSETKNLSDRFFNQELKELRALLLKVQAANGNLTNPNYSKSLALSELKETLNKIDNLKKEYPYSANFTKTQQKQINERFASAEEIKAQIKKLYPEEMSSSTLRDWWETVKSVISELFTDTLTEKFNYKYRNFLPQNEEARDLLLQIYKSDYLPNRKTGQSFEDYLQTIKGNDNFAKFFEGKNITEFKAAGTIANINDFLQTLSEHNSLIQEFKLQQLLKTSNANISDNAIATISTNINTFRNKINELRGQDSSDAKTLLEIFEHGTLQYDKDGNVIVKSGKDFYNLKGEKVTSATEGYVNIPNDDISGIRI